MLSDLANYGDSDEDISIDPKTEFRPIKKVKITIPDLVKDDIDTSKELISKVRGGPTNGSTLLSILPQPQAKISSVKDKPITELTKNNPTTIKIFNKLDKSISVQKPNETKIDLGPNDDIYEADINVQEFPISDDENEPETEQNDKPNTNYFFSTEDHIKENLAPVNIAIEPVKPYNIVHYPQPAINTSQSLDINLQKKSENLDKVSETLSNHESNPETEEFNHLVELHKFMPKRDRSNFQILPSSMENMQSMANGSIQFIEAKADDILGPQEVERNLTKAISEDHPSDLSSFKQNITQQQKRKHQITYLAYQAKEREYELQKQWAASKNSRQESRAKYGF